MKYQKYTDKQIGNQANKTLMNNRHKYWKTRTFTWK